LLLLLEYTLGVALFTALGFLIEVLGVGVIGVTGRIGTTLIGFISGILLTGGRIATGGFAGNMLIGGFAGIIGMIGFGAGNTLIGGFAGSVFMMGGRALGDEGTTTFGFSSGLMNSFGFGMRTGAFGSVVMGKPGTLIFFGRLNAGRCIITI